MTTTPAALLGTAFLTALLISLSIKLWLLWRQMRHVAAHRATVPAAFADRISLTDHQKAADYTLAKARTAIAPLFTELGLVLWLTLGGGLEWLHTVTANHFSGLHYGVVLIVTTMMFFSIIDLPFSLHRQFVIEARFGFNRTTVGLFVTDLVKQTALSAALGIPLLYAVLWLMNQMGYAWWLYVWMLWTGFNLLMLWAYPAFIAPLFNKFSPLADAALAERIEKLLTRCGFRSKGLFVMDGSKRSAHGNAYFTGLGNNKRIVFFDTLIERLTPSETEAVLAHELGHFRHRHIVQRMVLMFGGALGFLYLLAQLMQAPWFFAGLGVTVQNTALALLLFMFALPPFLFPLSPMGSLLSRRHEYQADRYAAQHAAASELISALVKLYQDNAATLTPDPVYSSFYDSHPPAALRIRALQTATVSAA